MMSSHDDRLDKQLYTINEAKEMLRCSDDTIRRMIAKKELDAVKVRGNWRIHRASLEKYLRPGAE